MVAGELLSNRRLVVPVEETRDIVLRLEDEDIIWPGFIDFHVHLGGVGLPGPGIAPHVLPAMGVFGAADGGSYSWDNPPESVLVDDLVVVRRWVALLPEGLTLHPYAPRYGGLTEVMVERARESLVSTTKPPIGIKIRLGQHDAVEDQRLLLDGVKLARALGLKVMVHVTDASIPFKAIQSALDAGDVVTHIFHGRRGSVMREGRMDPALEVARSRGIILDVGHGANHFSWRVLRQCLAEGLLPDTISTDMTVKTWGRPPVINLAFVCSKFVEAGLSWSQIYRATVTTPAHFLGMAPPSSLVILKAHRAEVAFPDAEGEVVMGKQYWQPEVVIKDDMVIKNDLITEGG